MKKYLFSLTIMLSSLIGSSNLMPNQIHQTITKINYDYRNINWDFSSTIPTNNEEIKINANVDFSQWDSSKPHIETNLLTMDIKIDKTKLDQTITNANSFGRLIDYLNNYADKTLNANLPFSLSPIPDPRFGRSLIGIWDFTQNKTIGGWQDSYWQIKDYQVGVDYILLKPATTINLEFLKI